MLILLYTLSSLVLTGYAKATIKHMSWAIFKDLAFQKPSMEIRVFVKENHWGKSQILVFTLSRGRPQWPSTLVVLKVWFPNQNYQHHLGARYESRISGPTRTDWMWHPAGRVQQSVYFCYWVQAHSAHRMTDQRIWEMRCWGKEYNFIRKTGWPRWCRLMSQSNHLVGGLDARFFYRVREREMKWGTKFKRQNREGEAVRK